MKKIDSLAELKTERLRLRLRRVELEDKIKNDFDSIKKSFSPVQLATDGAAKMLVNKNYGIVNSVTSTIIDLLLKNVLLRNAGIITRLVVPFLAKNTANNLVSNNKTKILGWIGELILKAGNKKKNNKNIYDQATADVNL